MILGNRILALCILNVAKNLTSADRLFSKTSTNAIISEIHLLLQLYIVGLFFYYPWPR